MSDPENPDETAKPDLRFDTRAIFAGQEPDPNTGSLMPPIHQTSTFVQESPGEHRGYEYSRTQNPTRESLEDCIASLEEGEHGFAFASGCAATSTVLQMLGEGARVVSCDDLYGGTHRLMTGVMEELGFEVEYVDMTDLEQLERALTDETDLVWLETPTNPLLKVYDVRAVCERAHAVDAPVAVDNTFLSPYFQQPLELGADLVVHSTTKFINGHSDVVGGAVVTDDDEYADRLAFLQNSVGAVPGPMDCWLVMRGIKTLPVRMRQHAENAEAVAAFLDSHPAVGEVRYPGLPSHPQYDLAQRQTSGAGGVVTFYLEGGLDEARSLLSEEFTSVDLDD
ncbi:MAG: PLP-dependent aspartate aminotransferase family protein, partial [Bradymonadaceae bacterium]